MNDTSIRYVRGNSSTNVARIETAATTRGRNARNDANTNASTASAPTAPSNVSPSTPGPLLLSLPAARTSSPVTPTAAPVGLAVSSASRIGVVSSFWLGDELKR